MPSGSECFNTASAAVMPNHPHVLIFYYNWTHWAFFVEKTLPPPFVETKWSLIVQNSSPLPQSWARWIQSRRYFPKVHINKYPTPHPLLCFQSCVSISDILTTILDKSFTSSKFPISVYLQGSYNMEGKYDLRIKLRMPYNYKIFPTLRHHTKQKDKNLEKFRLLRDYNRNSQYTN
jgi:hypothetical protein